MVVVGTGKAGGREASEKEDLLLAFNRESCKIYLLLHFLQEDLLDYPKPQ